MNNSEDRVLTGMVVLVAEDEPLVAMALQDELEAAGATVVGPAGTLAGALGMLDGRRIDAAVLDIKLQSDLVFPLADALAARGVPYLFTTGFSADSIPASYAHIPTCEKPASANAVVDALSRWTKRDA